MCFLAQLNFILYHRIVQRTQYTARPHKPLVSANCFINKLVHTNRTNFRNIHSVLMVTYYPQLDCPVISTVTTDAHTSIVYKLRWLFIIGKVFDVRILVTTKLAALSTLHVSWLQFIINTFRLIYVLGKPKLGNGYPEPK